VRPSNNDSTSDWIRKGVDLKTAIFILIQVGTLVWYQSSISARITALELKDSNSVPRSEYAIRDKGISDSLAEMKASQLRIEEKIDAINARK
jgi:hypothetical protein